MAPEEYKQGGRKLIRLGEMLRQVVLPGGGWVRQVALRVRTLLGELGMPQANGQPLCGRVPKKRGKERHPFFRRVCPF